MGANSKQALALTILLLGFVVMGTSFAVGGSIFLMLLSLVVIAASAAIFLKAKPLEHLEQ